MPSLGQDVEIAIKATDLVSPGVESARKRLKELEAESIGGIRRNVEAIGKQAQALEKVGKVAIGLEAAGAIGRTAFDAIAAAAQFAAGKISSVDAAVLSLANSIQSVPVAGRFFGVGSMIGEAIFGDTADAAAILSETAIRDRATQAMQRRAAETMKAERARVEREIKAIEDQFKKSQEEHERGNKEFAAEKIEKNASILRSIRANAEIDNQAAGDFLTDIAGQLSQDARRAFEDERSQLRGELDFFSTHKTDGFQLGSGEAGRFTTGAARAAEERLNREEALLQKQVELQERMLKALEANAPDFNVTVGVFQ